MRRSALLLALFIAVPVSAEVYSWRDRDGRVHYSDMPPPGSGAVVVRGAAQPAAAPAAPTESTSGQAGGTESAAPTSDAAASEGRRSLAEREREFRERRAAAAEAEAEAQKKAEQRAERERVCADLKNQLAGLESGQRVARFNAAGEREVMDDAARNEESARLRSQLESSCD